MTKRLISYVLLFVLLTSYTPVLSEVMIGDTYSFITPEELGVLVEWPEESQISYISLLDGISQKPQEEWRIITVAYEKNELFDFIPTTMLESTLKDMMKRAGMEVSTADIEGTSTRFYEVDLSSLGSDFPSSVYIAVEDGYMYSISFHNINKDTCKQTIASFRFGNEADSQPTKDTLAGKHIESNPAREVNLNAAPAAFQVPDGMYAVCANDVNADMLSRQGMTEKEFNTYMALSNYEAVLLPENELLKDNSYRIWVRIKDNSFSDLTTDFRDLEGSQRDLLVSSMGSGIMITGGGELLNNRQTDHMFFGGFTFMQTQMRYFTILKNRLIYIVLDTKDGNFSQEQRDNLLTVVDSLYEK